MVTSFDKGHFGEPRGLVEVAMEDEAAEATTEAPTKARVVRIRSSS